MRKYHFPGAMSSRRIDPAEAMENAARRAESAAVRRMARGGIENEVRGRLLLAGADMLRREADDHRTGRM